MQQATQAQIAEANRQHQREMTELRRQLGGGGGQSSNRGAIPAGMMLSEDGRSLVKMPVVGLDGQPIASTNAAQALPASALRMQNEALDAIGVANSIKTDLAALDKQIQEGKLSFGPISNLISTGANLAGMSTENSRNFATFKSSLERLRNESLRLNTGVQTDGDAQRAWNELFQNITDTDLVRQRLQEIQRINERGAQLQQLKVDSVRLNYGLPPMDFSPYSQQPAAVGSRSQTSAPATPPRVGPVASQPSAPTSPRVLRFDAQGNIVQ
jgi:hypothetical protein